MTRQRLRRGAAGCAALLAVVLVGCSGEGTEDVAVGACAADPAGGKPVASGIIVNQSSKPSTYVIRIAFFDSDGNRVSEGVDSVGRVEPGQRAQWNASGAANATGTLRCEATATRSEAPGG